MSRTIAHQLLSDARRGIISKDALLRVCLERLEDISEEELYRLALDEGFLGPKKIRVPSISYLLGLADVVGELRRLTLDSLRKGDLKVAESSLETMEIIYDGIMSMDEALHVVGELRRKSDSARRIIEATRGDVTVEARKHSLERSIEKLERITRKRTKMKT